MAGNSPPRRSSRARTAQSQSQSQHSSTTSSLSGRPERATRSLNKAASPQKSTPSLSDEPPDESVASTDDLPTRRRRTRAQEQEQEREREPAAHITVEMPLEPDDIQEDDEAVRCICGFEEYPGPPPVEEEKKHHGLKDSIDAAPLLPPDVNDDVAGFFVQCDVCSVWQHGACVGIMSEKTSPEEYFCEECRKDLHKIQLASNGQKYSLYLPLAHNSRTSATRSRSPKERDNKDARETRSGRQSSLTTQTSKRRSTMNSRDAAYDEEEELRRAIEASKEEATHDGPEPSNSTSARRTKRGRSGSEEKAESAKRQRTKSTSPSPVEDDADQTAAAEDSEEPSSITRNGSKKSRNGTARTQAHQKEKTEREERERQRAEAAKKRNGRAERRRADGSTLPSTTGAKGSDPQMDTDSDPSEELPLAARTATTRAATDKLAAAAAAAAASSAGAAAATTAVPADTESKAEAPSAPEPPPSSQPIPDTPPAVSAPTQAASKPRRTKKKGRNQYTKDREAREEGSPARSQSRDVQGHDSGNNHHGKSGEGSSKSHSRAKGGFNSKVSMTEMRRKAHAMLDYISRTQIEMAGEITPPNDESRRASRDNAAESLGSEKGTSSGDKASVDTSADTGPGPSAAAPAAPAALAGEFKELTSIEMMDRLTRDLVKWQKEFTT